MLQFLLSFANIFLSRFLFGNLVDIKGVKMQIQPITNVKNQSFGSIKSLKYSGLFIRNFGKQRDVIKAFNENFIIGSFCRKNDVNVEFISGNEKNSKFFAAMRISKEQGILNRVKSALKNNKISIYEGNADSADIAEEKLAKRINSIQSNEDFVG